MAQSSTIDNQKVFNSATENFKSFVGNVENVSHTKHMEEIYANMTKLFDAFTGGTLLEQGANSETLLRTVYRSLDEDFLEIVQDTDAVNKLVEVIKSKQEGIEPDKVAEAMVSETTKKVVTKTLNPETCDPMQVVLDFLDELQTSILQVKLNLSREYERRRLEYAKSLAGKEEDLERLREESQQQTTEISNVLGQVSTEEEEWKKAHLQELSRLMERFDQVTGKASANVLAQTLKSDKNLTKISNGIKKVDWDKLIGRIQQNMVRVPEKVEAPIQAKGETPTSVNKPSASTSPDTRKVEKDVLAKGDAIGEQGKEQSGITLKDVNNPDAQKKEEGENAQNADEGKRLEQQEKPPKDELGQMVPQLSKIGKDVVDVQKKQQESDKKKSDTKLQVKPSKNGMHACSICGYVHPYGDAHIDKGQKQQEPQRQLTQNEQPPATDQQGSKITKNGVVSTIGKIHQNIQKQLGKKRFRNGFTMDFNKIQGGLQKQMKKVDKAEESIHKDLNKTKKGIKQLQDEKKKKGGLLGMLLGGGIGRVIFTIVGGLILITLARMAIKKWSDTYMPKNDGSTMSIFGIPIPGWSTMKALGLGIWNFITIGLPNYWDRLSHFIGNIKKQLFGRKGIFRDGIETRNTLRKVLWAIGIGFVKQKLVGPIAKILSFAVQFIPGVGPVCKLLIKFVPALLTFITAQVMMSWSNGKAAAERQAQGDAANQMASGKSQVKHFGSILLTNAKGVQPFKGQLNSIQGLQTSSRKGGKIPTKGAIMRYVPTHTNKNFNKAEAIQDKNLDQDRKQNIQDVEQRLKDNNKGDLLVTIHNTSKKLADELKYIEIAKRQGNATPRLIKAMNQKAEGIRLKIAEAIIPQIKTLDSYILQLSKSPRFKNVKGPLYDPDTGWNPGYRVYASDLRSIIPLKPFEALHKTADVYFGQPADAEMDSIGFMPFTWTQDGVKISVHPINYELARAKGIRGIYENMLKSLTRMKVSDPNGADPSFVHEYLNDPTWLTKAHANAWIRWNRALTAKYEKPDNVLFKDRFGRFLKKLRAGKIQGKDNNLETAKGQAQGLVSEWWEDGSDAVASGNIMGAATQFGAIGMIAATGVLAVKAVKNKIKDVRRIFDYDKGDPNLEYKEGDSWLQRRKKDAKRLARKVKAAAKVAIWRNAPGDGFTYGDVRDFWLESGALDLFANGQIMGTAGAAIPLLQFLIKKNMLPKAPKEAKANELHDLMHWFFGLAGIKGYQWKQVDEYSQAGFAQVFLEYLNYKVLPQWNRVEKLLSNEITYGTQDTRSKLEAGIKLLNALMSQKNLFNFMYKHLRFPNMEVKLIDYSNASLLEKTKLDKYREEMGIPNSTRKDAILKKWQSAWNGISKLGDEQLDKAIQDMSKMLVKAEFEARFTGDYAYFRQLSKIYQMMEKEKQARLDAQASGDKIVKKAGDVKTKLLEPPPKTMAEIEEERKKKAEEEARQKAEQERKEKEEREKKLKEEAKRKEALAIANAKIKAMEAIRKQEENYESILQKMISDPGKVTDKELKSLGDEVNNLKQEAENQIAKLPREERELKLALIRGDKISEKTFTEIKETTIGLHGNLQEYINEVNKIPVGSVLAINNGPGGNAPQPVMMQDSDSVDLGDL